MTHSISKKITLMAITACVFSTHVQADTIFGIYADATVWGNQNESQIQKGNLQENISYDFSTSANFSVAIEHLIPLVPNVKLRHGIVESSQEMNVDIFQIDNIKFDSNITAKSDFTHTDVLAYYEILDNWVSVDVGLGAKVIDSNFSVKSTTLGPSIGDKVRSIVPMLYVSAGGSLPLTGFSAKADVAGIQYEENKVVDAQAEIKYDFIDNITIDLGVKAGYRILELQTDKIYNSLITSKFQGPYVGLEAHF